MKDLQYCEILKTKISVTNMRETTEYIKAHMDELRGKYICVSNVHTTVMSYEDEIYRQIQCSFSNDLRGRIHKSQHQGSYGNTQSCKHQSKDKSH